MYVPQAQLERLKFLTQPGKVVVIFGPRRVGKTTLLKQFLADAGPHLFVTGEDVFMREALTSGSIEKLKAFIGDHHLLVIDEAQHIPEIGLNLKLVVDHLPHVKVIATGSSTFDLAKEMGEPLTGRKFTIRMYPLSQIELNQIQNNAQTNAQLDARLIYGSYPEIITHNNDAMRKEYLRDLVSSYLFKDILAFDGVKKSKKLIDLLTLLAFRIGHEVSVSEIASQLGMSKNTVERYLDLLQQVFVLINIRGFSRNLRKEVTKTSRYYFCDIGVRNALINNFNSLKHRNDQGSLWENYIVLERLKKQEYTQLWSNNYFWRTYDQKEIDWVEEREGHLFGYEIKWGNTIAKPPKLWISTYSNASFECINQSNYLKFIT